MNMWKQFAGRGSICILLFGLTTASALAQNAAQASAAGSAEETSVSESGTMSSSEAASDAKDLPDSPGATRARVPASDPQEIAVAQQTDVPELPAAPQAGPSSAGQQEPAAEPTTRTPVGTAAAPSLTTTGVAASEPAGVAIAPEKQRRVRTIVIRVGAIIAAGVAVGIVVGLSEATSSKPPGAH
jgi:hypothetical protein